MAKTRYPKKFRQKLEKIAAARDERAGREPAVRKRPEDMTEDELLDAAGDMLWREFLPPGSVELMHAKMNENQRRIEITCHMELPRRNDVIRAPAPWLTEDEIETFRSS